MDMDFQAKVEKYEGKAAKCKEAAQKAAEGAHRTMYEVMAGYYAGLATDFRQAIEKRKVA
jgi:ribosomal protein S5